MQRMRQVRSPADSSSARSHSFSHWTLICAGASTMLIRLRGAESGIKEYLETGRKDGRDYSRVELDERVVLVGNLEQIDQVLGYMRKKGDQYLHVTLSFKEDDVDEGGLRAVPQRCVR